VQLTNPSSQLPIHECHETHPWSPSTGEGGNARRSRPPTIAILVLAPLVTKSSLFASNGIRPTNLPVRAVGRGSEKTIACELGPGITAAAETRARDVQIVGLGFLLFIVLLTTHARSRSSQAPTGALASLAAPPASAPPPTPCSLCPKPKQRVDCEEPVPCECLACAILHARRYEPGKKPLVGLEGMSLFQCDGDVQRAMHDWRRDAILSVHLIGNREAAALIDRHYPHYRLTYDRMMEVHPIFAAGAQPSHGRSRKHVFLQESFFRGFKLRVTSLDCRPQY
jgi:hypothetical protein